MMPIISIPVKMSSGLGFDILLMAVERLERIQEEKILISCIYDLRVYCSSQNITLIPHFKCYVFLFVCLFVSEGESRNFEGF